MGFARWIIMQRTRFSDPMDALNESSQVLVVAWLSSHVHFDRRDLRIARATAIGELTRCVMAVRLARGDGR